MSERNDKPYTVCLSPTLALPPQSFSDALAFQAKRRLLSFRLQDWIHERSLMIASGPTMQRVDPGDIDRPCSLEIDYQIRTADPAAPIWKAGLGDESNDDQTWSGTKLMMAHKIDASAKNSQRRLKHRTQTNHEAVRGAIAPPSVIDVAERTLAAMREDVGLTNSWQQLPPNLRTALGMTQYFQWPAEYTLEDKYKALEANTGTPANTWKTWRHKAIEMMYQQYRRQSD